MVQGYCTSNNLAIAAPDLPGAEEKPPKPDTKVLSYDLYKSGKTIDEIAAERGFVRSTIEGHLAHFVGLGELSIFDLMAAETVAKIEQFFLGHPGALSAEARAHFGEAYSYGEIKMVMSWMAAERGEQGGRSTDTQTSPAQ